MWACIWYSAERLTGSQAHKLQRTENSAVNTPTRRRGQGCGYFCSRASAGEKRYRLLWLFISIKRQHLAARELKDRTASYGFHVSNTCCSHDDICASRCWRLWKKGFLAIFLEILFMKDRVFCINCHHCWTFPHVCRAELTDEANTHRNPQKLQFH